MPVERVYIGWDRPPPRALAAYLAAIPAAGGLLDLSAWTIVLPVARAGRRTLAALVRECDVLGLRLMPPRFATPARLLPMLIEPRDPALGKAARLLLWTSMLRDLSAEEIRAIVRRRPEGFAQAWRLARVLADAHEFLASRDLGFAELARDPRVDDRSRWEALARVETAYSAAIDRMHLADPHIDHRRRAESSKCEGTLALCGIVELPPVIRRAITAVVAQGGDVRVLTLAPDSLADHFDALGGVLPGWPAMLPPERLDIAQDADEQSDAIFRWISTLPAPCSAADVGIGLCDERLAATAIRRGAFAGVPLRHPRGRPLTSSPPCTLLVRISAFLHERSFRSLAPLVRHPDMERSRGPGAACLARDLDRVAADHLAADLCALPESVALPLRQSVDRAVGQVLALVGDLAEVDPRPFADWAHVIRALVQRVYGDRDLNPVIGTDRVIAQAFDAIDDIARDLRAAPIPRTVLTATEALDALVSLLDPLFSPPPEDASAVELLGWLDAVFDDAPHACIASINEGFLPSRPPRDPILTPRLRRVLGLDVDRAARDAYYLRLVLESRPGVYLVCSRRGPGLEPLSPTSLVASGGDSELLDFVRRWAPELPPARRPRAASILPAPAADSRLRALPVEPDPDPPDLPMRLSVTDFGRVLRSPYLYYLERILRVREVLDEVDELDGRGFGSLIHEAIAAYGREPSPPADEQGVAEYLRGALDRLIADRHGPRPAPAVTIQRDLALVRLRAFAAWQAVRFVEGWRILHVEWPETMRAVPLPDCRLGTLITGRIDRVDTHPDEGLQLLDIKTGADDPEKSHRTRGEWTKDLQLPLYRVLASDIIGERRCGLGYITLPGEGKVAAVLASWSDADLDMALVRAREIAGWILESRRDHSRWRDLGRGTPPTPIVRAICGESMILDDDEEPDEETGA